jgi:hypothetical protein
MARKVLIVLAVVALVAWWLWPSGRRWPPGVLVSADPRMELADEGAPWSYTSHGKEYQIVPRGRWSGEARVLSVNADYDDAAIGPLDLTIGWGKMSDQAVVDRMRIWQDNTRHWYCQPRGEWPIPMEQVALHAVNTHLIPATSTVESDLRAIGKGDVVTLDGQLVDVRRNDGFHWNTSLEPGGFGDHSCKIIWVERVARR